MKKGKWSSDCKGTVFEKRCTVCEVVNLTVVVLLIIIFNLLISDNFRMSIFIRIIINIVSLFFFAFLEEKYISKPINYIISKIIK